MFSTEREAYRALQQYKADLERSKMQLRRNSTIPLGVSIIDFQDRGRTKEQDRGPIDRARRGSDGDNARTRKMSYDQELAKRCHLGLIRSGSDKSNDNIDGATRTAESHLADLDRQWTGPVRVDEPFITIAIAQVPTFARQTLNRFITPGNFAHHRNTFAIAKAKRNPGNKYQPMALPQPIMINLVRYIDHQTYLSLRLVSRSWNKSIDHVKPPQHPAVHKVPTDVIQRIYHFILAGGVILPSHAVLSVNDFNNARHSCRAWMAASLEKEILACALYQAGLLPISYSFEAGSQDLNDDDKDEDDLVVLWEMSLRLAKYCDSMA